MEPEPLKPEADRAGPVPLGYAGPGTEEWRRGRPVGALVAYPAVLVFGLLFAGVAVGLLGDRITGGTTGLELREIVILLLIGSLFTWAGALGARYLYLQRTGQPLPPTTSRLTRTVRRLFHTRQGG